MNPAHRLATVVNKDSRRIIGLMSGMSMDGVDLAMVQISGTFPDLRVALEDTHFRPYTAPLRERLRGAQNGGVQEASRLNFIVAREFADCVREFLDGRSLDAGSIDAIGSHGQTLYHSTEAGEECPSTLQVGAPSVIAELTGILTVGNFRLRDVAAGGQAAPLVSFADYVLFRDPSRPVALNNLGSISNVTVVTPGFEDMVAFDTGPANMAIDFFARRTPGNVDGIDHGGALAAQGTCVHELLDALLSLPFFSRPPPRAAGYDEFGPQRLAQIAQPFIQCRPQDLLRTGVEFAAVTLRDAYRGFVLPRFPQLQRALFSGGGIYNHTLMKRITELLPEIRIETLPHEWSDAKEAIAFALLAHQTLSGLPATVAGTTGVRKPVVLGEIAL